MNENIYKSSNHYRLRIKANKVRSGSFCQQNMTTGHALLTVVTRQKADKSYPRRKFSTVYRERREKGFKNVKWFAAACTTTCRHEAARRTAYCFRFSYACLPLAVMNPETTPCLSFLGFILIFLPVAFRHMHLPLFSLTFSSSPTFLKPFSWNTNISMSFIFWHSAAHSQASLFLPSISTNFLDWAEMPLALMNLFWTFRMSSQATWPRARGTTRAIAISLENIFKRPDQKDTLDLNS